MITDASFLDEWSFDQFQSLMNRSSSDENLRELLQQDNLVIFLHLLGCDSNGHAHRPFSSIYLNNVKVVDQIARRVYDLVEGYFKDNQTAYVFTADHGMSDKGNVWLRFHQQAFVFIWGAETVLSVCLVGSHGDGHPTNTDTPLVAWGAGIKHPKPILSNAHPDHGLRFIDEHLHDMPTPPEWGLSTIERVDVNQADIAPLMVVQFYYIFLCLINWSTHIFWMIYLSITVYSSWLAMPNELSWKPASWLCQLGQGKNEMKTIFPKIKKNELETCHLA